jgi:hypothetical protein
LGRAAIGHVSIVNPPAPSPKGCIPQGG